VQEKFVAQSLVETRTDAGQRRFELTFVDATGARQAISLPAGVAADLAPVLASLAANLGAAAQSSFTKVPKLWAVGSAPHERLVLLRFDDDPPYALAADAACDLWREVREEAEEVSRMKAPARQ
jgi:hypothetical protein